MNPPRRLSLERVHKATRIIDPIFLNTPQLVSEPFGEALGVRTTLKVETLNPVRSFKGRGADFLVINAERRAAYPAAYLRECMELRSSRRVFGAQARPAAHRLRR